ncbi:MAG: hypothetical protein Q9227_004499 [Pyrenula ochraceoflavens]
MDGKPAIFDETRSDDESAKIIKKRESRLIRKIDIRLMPWVVLTFLCAAIDKVNIGNAVIFNLDEDLHLKGSQFNTCVVMFFVTYCFLDVPATMIMRRVKPHIWLSFLTFSFGIVAMCEGFTQSFGGLVVARLFLGITQAGSFSNCFYLISMWYKREEAQRRFTLFYSSVNLAAAFGGLLASAIGLLGGNRGYSGWRWVFIIEGALTSVIALLLFVMIPDFPEQAKWLSPEEKRLACERLRGSRENTEPYDKDAFTSPLGFKSALRIIIEPKILLGGVMYFALVLPAAAFNYFAPTIIHTFTKSAIHTQLLSVAPWAASFVATMLCAYFSDVLRHRFLFSVLPLFLAIAGYILLLAIPADPSHHSSRYAALFLVSIGMFIPLPIQVCWFNMNVLGHRRRSVSLGWQIAFGNAASIPGVYLFLKKDAPDYTTGYATSLAFVVLAGLLNVGYWVICRQENLKRAKGHGEIEEQVEDDRSPSFRNML